MYVCILCTCHSIHAETTGQFVGVRSLLSTPESWGWNSGNQVSGKHLYPLNHSAGSWFCHCKGLFFNSLFYWVASAAGAAQVKDVTRSLFDPVLATAYGRPWEMVGFHLLSMFHRENVQKETAHDATILQQHLVQGRGERWQERIYCDFFFAKWGQTSLKWKGMSVTANDSNPMVWLY